VPEGRTLKPVEDELDGEAGEQHAGYAPDDVRACRAEPSDQPIRAAEDLCESGRSGAP